MIIRRLAFCLLLIAAAAPAGAQLRIDITQGNVDPLPVAIPDFPGDTAESARLGKEIAQVIANDLERSGLFKPLNRAAFIEQIKLGHGSPRFADWRQINAAGLVIGQVNQSGDGLKVSFRLWDVFTEQQVAGKEYNTFPNNWRRIAHIVADEIYKRLTGEDGYFDTRIVYVAESGPEQKRVKRLAIMDQDGENHRFLTDGRTLVLTPRFSPSSQEILYLSYAGKQPRVFLRDLQTGREESLGRFEGMSFAPRFSPDGNTMVMSIAEGGVSSIYSMNLRSRKMSRLTDGNWIDTSPSFSPDGRQIVFNSDRGGSQQLYVMDGGGGNPQRISFGEGRYGTPVWSPRGDWVAFTKMHGGRFHIGVMRPDGSGERLLTESFLDEGPTWSPNGRVIMFNRQFPSGGSRGGISKLFSVDLTGYNLREIVTPVGGSDPAWSPLLPL